MATRVRVDPEVCQGSAECIRLLPDAFRIVKALGVSVPTDAADTADHALLAEVVRSCPTGAIHAEIDG